MTTSDNEKTFVDNLFSCVPDSYKSEVVPARIDWGEAVSSGSLYGREQELVMLEHWLLCEQVHLIAVVGMGGMGKTVLVEKLTQRVQAHFDFIIWRSLRNAPRLEDIISDCLSFFSRSEVCLPDGRERNLSLLIHYLQSARCLLVLDNVETILQDGEVGRAGHYRVGYEDYGRFLLQIGKLSHKSCVVLTSREKPKELSQLEGGKSSHTRSLRLTGLNDDEGKQFLQEQGLLGSTYESSMLNHHYAGNPLALRLVAGTIHALFGDSIASFLHKGKHIFGDIRDLLDEQFERLSLQEKRVLYWLAIERDLVSLDVLITDIMPTSPGDNVLEVLDFLFRRRSWIERGDHDQTFTLQPVIMEYVTLSLIEQVYSEIQSGSFQLFRHHALLKAQARDYIRNTQKHLILKPLLERLLSQSRKNADNMLVRSLVILQLEAQQKGYAAGNILNLLASLTTDLRGYDFSNLTIWQAYLQGVDLRDADFSFSDVATSVFTGAFSSILSIAFNADESLLAAGTTKGDIWVWDINADKLLFSCEGHNAWVMSVAFNADGTMLASGGGDHAVKLWDLKHGQQIKSFEGHTREVSIVTFSPDGKLLASGSYDQRVVLWEIQSERQLKVFQVYSGEITVLAFSVNGKFLATGDDNGYVNIWEIESKACLRSFQGHSSKIHSIAFGLNADVLISASIQNVRTWQIATGECFDIFDRDENTISAMYATDTTILIACRDAGTIRLYDIHAHAYVSILTEPENTVDPLVLSPKGKLLAATDENQRLKIWHVQSGQCLRMLQGYTNPLWSLTFNADGTNFASGGDDRLVRIWNASNGQCFKALRGHTKAITTIAFNHNGTLLASGSWDQCVRLWDVQSGQCLKILQGHESTVWSIAFSPDGSKLLCGCQNQSAKVWDVQTGQCLHALPGQDKGADALSVIASPNGMLLACSGKDCAIHIWDIDRCQHLYTLQGHTSPIWSLAFSPDGSMLASGSGDQHLKLWSMASGEALQTMRGHEGWISALAFRHDGNMLVSGGSDQCVNLWNVHTGQLLARHQEHKNRVIAVALSPNGNMLVSSDFDEHNIMWDMRKKTIMCTLNIDRPYERMDISSVTGLTDPQKSSLKALGALELHTPETTVPAQLQDIHLTRREKDILRLIIEGYSNNEIAQTLYVSKATVKTHINNVFTKMGVQNRSQATFVAQQLNLLS